MFRGYIVKKISIPFLSCSHHSPTEDAIPPPFPNRGYYQILIEILATNPRREEGRKETHNIQIYIDKSLCYFSLIITNCLHCSAICFLHLKYLGNYSITKHKNFVIPLYSCIVLHCIPFHRLPFSQSPDNIKIPSNLTLLLLK